MSHVCKAILFTRGAVLSGCLVQFKMLWLLF
uniref:Uncharacterized protein n=1 Tax=Anguilla anguilla TaxID=7936 RepID=A0A0E9XKC5_ANGAN